MATPADVWSLLERAADFPADGPALVGPGGPRSYLEARDRAAALATGLAALGARRGDRVALLDDNSLPFFETTYAVAGLGAILVPLNAHLAPNELAAVLQDATPRVWIASSAYAELVDSTLALLDSPPELVWIGDHGDGHRYESLTLQDASEFVPADVAHADPVHLYYTSGTTGRAKGVVLTQGNVLHHAEAAATELDLAADDVWAHLAPMFHLADAWATLGVTLAGGRHAFLPRFETDAALELLQRERVTVTNVVPTMLQRLVARAPEKAFDASALRLILSGGAPIAPTTVERVLDVFRCEYVQTYGLTETSPFLTLAILSPHHREQPQAEQLRRHARTGRPFETVELEVVDEEGTTVAQDDRAVGEIRARGATVTPGYWNRPDETAAAFRDGWFHTGDLATVDREGWLNIVDRKKDMILTGGENVYSIEVENALYAHPAVLECAAYGVPHAEWGEEVRAAVVLRPGMSATADELRELCRTRIAAFKVPKAIVLTDELPKTGSGKIAKRLLRDRA